MNTNASEPDLYPLIEEVLANSREMVLATTNNDTPWASALVYGHDKDFHLYWVSFDKSRHTLEVLKNPKVAAVINRQPTGGDQDKGLQIEGRAQKLEENRILSVAREFYAKRGKDVPNTLEELEKLPADMSWYELVPEKIHIYYGPLFGFKRQEYTV